MKKTLTFERPRSLPSYSTSVIWSFPFTIVDSALIGTPEEKSRTSQHQVKVAASMPLIGSWGIDNYDLVKVLFEYGRRHVIEKLQDEGALASIEKLNLNSSNAESPCPFDPSRIQDPVSAKLEVDTNIQEESYDATTETQKEQLHRTSKYNLTDDQKALLRRLVEYVKEGKLDLDREFLVDCCPSPEEYNAWICSISLNDGNSFEFSRTSDSNLVALCKTDPPLVSFRWNRQGTDKLYRITQAGLDAIDSDFDAPSPVTTQHIRPDSILIVTATRVEAQAVLSVFSQAAGAEWTRQVIGNKIYYNLGVHGGAPIFMVQSEKGTATPGGALVTVRQAIQDLCPQAVIMCGIAFGLHPDEQELGDILVTKQIQYYEPQKVDLQQGQISRGDRTTSAERLLDRFRSGDNDWQGAPTHFGLVLSGEMLVNDPVFRDWLLKTEPEAIGGEMEGAGLYVAAREAKVDWILVKAICDWADGTKNNEAQPLATRNAAEFVLHVLQLGGWDRPEILDVGKSEQTERIQQLSQLSPTAQQILKLLWEGYNQGKDYLFRDSIMGDLGLGWENREDRGIYRRAIKELLLDMELIEDLAPGGNVEYNRLALSARGRERAQMLWPTQ